MPAHLAETMLETMRHSMGLSVGSCQIQRPDIGDAWRIDATDAMRTITLPSSCWRGL
jgi:hypothetical protein